MPVVVHKYGGSSVADVERLGRVADKVVAAKSAGDDVVVVISAMGTTTDELLALAHAVDKNPPRRELDMLVTTGERVSMALLSMAIQKRGKDAISFTGSQCGIITNDRHFDARIIEVRPFRIEDELARGRVVIVAGYQGMSYKREITTLGRGGSDTTAVALAAALGAERCEIYSDVDGVYSADPRVVESAEHLAQLSYDEMQQIAEAGASVLNSTAVEYARRARIAIYARSTFSPGKETVIDERAIADPNQPRCAVIGRTDLLRLELSDERELDAAVDLVEQLGLSVRHSALAQPSPKLIIAHMEREFGALRDRFGEALEDSLGAVSVVASDLSQRPRIAIVAHRALEEIGVTPLALFGGPMRLTSLIGSGDVDEAVRAVHRAVLES